MFIHFGNDYQKSRLAHVNNYRKLVIDMQVGEYLAGTMNLDDVNFQEALDHYITLENYEICQQLVDKRKSKK